MRHNVDGRKFRRTPSHRKALLKNLAISLILHERIETTVAKAKELRRVVERMITLGKRGDIASRRRAFALLRHEPSVAKLFSTFATVVSIRSCRIKDIARFFNNAFL